ncbi:PREDICTED: uncharacterized protein LOC109220384 [Nicotiana attenuata]|uniref:uncharacterized protein LOC109220384 n=1 Tax=Nicotiana attenuata TaxID=49451 RepID=UPI0009048A41|nr:PREDICTED: uncharacterized protein LOC109220384 [Nicotiana attenuata]
MKADQRHATSKLISGYIIDNLRDPRFLYMFYAYGSSISGWNHCRPAIAVDATFLKSKFCGVLMISVSKDANNQIFPLAFGIAEYENNNSYEWYFSQLRNAIGSRENLIFLSDRHQAIAYGIAKAQRFDLYMSDIAKIDKKTYDYLMEEPPKRWARSCSPRRRYDMLTTNIVESMNFVLLEARELPILRMMDFIQVKLQRWFYERRNEAEGTFYDVSCWVEEELKKKIDLAFTLNVFPVDSWRSRVEEEAIEKRNIKKSNFCSHWYLKESWLKTYERQIHPVGHTDSWIVPESVKSQIVKPPDFKVPPGRRQKKRHIPATESSKITFKCGRCRRIGHNRTTCIYSPAVHPFSRKHRE